MAVGQSILTTQGILKLSDASRTGKSIKPQSYRVSNQDIPLDPTLTTLPGVWKSGDISGYIPISNDTVEFLIDIPQEEATGWGRTFGLYLDDGTLFMIAKPPYPFPPSLRQIFKIQLTFSNIQRYVNFQYIPFYETQQDLMILDNIFTTTQSVETLRKDIELLKLARDRLFANDREVFSAIERIQENIEKILSDIETLQTNQIALATNINTLSYILAQNTANISALISSLRLNTI